MNSRIKFAALASIAGGMLAISAGAAEAGCADRRTKFADWTQAYKYAAYAEDSIKGGACGWGWSAKSRARAMTVAVRNCKKNSKRPASCSVIMRK